MPWKNMQMSCLKRKLNKDSSMGLKKIFGILIVAMLTASYSQSSYFEKPFKIKVEYIVDSFENEALESTISSSVLENLIQNADTVYFGSTGECECDCAGGDLLFYFSNDKKHVNFYTGGMYDRLCSPLSERINLIWKFKDSKGLKAVVDMMNR